MNEQITIKELFSLDKTIAAGIFEGAVYPWEVLSKIGDYIVELGNSTELKNVILFDNVQVPHYNYVGDSILGYKAHMGAGSITSNVKSDKKLVAIKGPDGNIDTGIKKIGAFLGDNVEIGCGSVLNPGTIIGRNSNIYPLSSVRGCIKSGSIYKNRAEVVEKY